MIDVISITIKQMHNDANSTNLLCEMSIATILKTNSFLPISKTILPFFLEEHSQYNFNPFSQKTVTDEKCIYDEGFALVKRVELSTSNAMHFNTIVIETEANQAREVQYTSKHTSRGITYFVWDMSLVVKNISLPESGMLRNASHIKITGRELSDLQSTYENLEGSYQELDDEWNNKLQKVNKENEDLEIIKEQVKTIKSALSDLKAEHAEYKAEIEIQSNELSAIDVTRDQMNDEIQNLIEHMEEQQEKLSHLKKEKEQVIGQKNSLKEQLETVKDELHKNQIENSRYSEDFDTFKQELALQNKLFIGLLTLFLAVGSYIAYNLVDGSYDVLRAFNSGVNIYELMISRVPTVLIHSIIIVFLGKWITFVTEGLMTNLNDLKKLKQLVYLVREVTESQSIGLDASDEPNTRYKQRVSEKMAIVRDALCIVPSSDSVSNPSGKTTSTISQVVSEAIKKKVGS
ncbi:hypothetical protein VCHA39O220_100022 [Vibrio chagasii]|nr:hypothetical protein VCHA40O235_100022 [Vibrio chagasii]CAH6890260.1 hypothetical protein VCHA39O220_100022 [Vibrio chagasii]CAH6902807.1 hypothetical protein VCHA48P434_100021 [Vibrio chagasii]CAH6935742.1 hypothetical protein VCHA53O466_110190 [Vibrio chagasii]CAH7279544.1 hypothetical protein VCHA52P456_30183 [Vibrio chagasii]